MHTLAFLIGVTCLFVVLLDAFQTIILPRRATGRFRLTKLFYLVTWGPWKLVARIFPSTRKRETFFSYYGPLSLIFLLVLWAAAIIFGFALVYFAIGNPFADTSHLPAFVSDLYVSGTTLFTLGLGDVTPQSLTARILVILEAGTGLGFLAVVMGYFPVLYSAFSRREVSIALLDARAGSPPTAAELLRRHSYQGAERALATLLLEWERWSAELLESHISYPLLCYFRSQHTNQSWLSALIAILDTSSLLIAGVQANEARQAQLTFAMARHAIVDLSQVLSLKPKSGGLDRLPPERCEQLNAMLGNTGVHVCRDGHTIERLRELRAFYEGYAVALSQHLEMPLPPWFLEYERKDNWMTVARVRAEAEAANPTLPQDNAVAKSLSDAGYVLWDHHDF